jgi:hypothetical protein
MWTGHDDLMDRVYIGRCVEALDHDPDSVLCFASPCYLDQHGKATAPPDVENPGGSESASTRLLNILFNGMCDPIFGVMRTAVLRRTGLHGAYADSDRVLLAELGLRGRFVLLPERLFFRRVHAAQTTTRHRDYWERTLVFDPSRSTRLSFPWLQENYDVLAAIWRAPVSRRERHQCFKAFYWWASAHRHLAVQDVWRGVHSCLKRLLPRRQAPGGVA